jgi:hypothetical protein
MVSVIGMSKDLIDEIANALVTGGLIDVDGNFYLVTRDGTQIDTGRLLVTGDPGPIGPTGLTGPAGPSGTGWTGPTSFTPAIIGGGAATFSSATGYYYVMGDLVFFTCTIVGNAAGSGSTALTFNGPPVNINRADRQTILGHGEGNTNMNGPIEIVSFVGGTGFTWDRLRTAAGANAIGTSLLSGGATYCFTGMYRKA